MTTPAIVWRGTNGNNYSQGRDGQRVIAICNHIIAGPSIGSIESADSWFKSNGSGASAHFGVAKDGRIWQWVDEADMAWANGRVTLSTNSPAWLRSIVSLGQNPNDFTISIEHEGQPGDQVLEPQYQASLALQKYLVEKYQIKLDREHIIGHYQVDAVNRPNCPGPNYPWKRLMSDLLAALPPAPDPNVWHCLETDKWVTNDQGFLTYWRTNGGLAEFGFPVSGAAPMPGQPGIIAQWFERARLEYHTADRKIYRGLVGAELYAILQNLPPTAI